MPHSEQGSAAHAGFVRFPRRSIDLTDTTHCPACFEALEGAVCPACELDLRHPAASELAAVSAQAAGLIERRWELIGRIRNDSPVAIQRRAMQRRAAAERRAAQSVAPPVGPPIGLAVEAPVLPGRPAGGPPPPPVARPARPAQPAQPAHNAQPAQEPRRSSVQVLLLVVGITLVSVAAIFFLLYAFTNYGIVGRSLVIGAVTVAAFAVASLLRRGRLTSTAEGIAVFAVVLVYLDAFAVRANNLLGSGSSDPLLYWGAALVLSSLGFVLWHRASRLRVPNIVAFAAFAPGVALVVGALSAPLDTPTRVFLAFLAAGLAGLVHPLAERTSASAPATGSADARPRLPERIVAFSTACVGLALSFCTAFVVAPGVDAAVLPALAGVSLVAAAHAVLLARAPQGSVLLRGFAALSALAISTGVVTAAYRSLPPAVAMPVAAAAATVILLGLLLVARKRPLPAPGPALPSPRVVSAAAIAAGCVAAIAVAVPGTQALLIVAQTVLLSLGRVWRADVLDTVVPASAASVGAVAALAVVVALVAGFAAVSGAARLLRGALVWGCCVVLVAAVPVLGPVWSVTAGWLALSAAALTLLLLLAPMLARGARARPVVAPLAATAATAAAFGYATSWASTGTWLAGSCAVVVLLLAARWIAVPGSVSAVVAPPRASTPPPPRASTPPPPPVSATPAPVVPVPAMPVPTMPVAAMTVSAMPVSALPTARATASALSPTAVYRAALLGAAAVIAFLAAAAAASLPAFVSGTVGSPSASLDTARAVSIIAVLLLAIAAIPTARAATAPRAPAAHRLSDSDRHTLFALSGVVAAISVPVAGALHSRDPDAPALLTEPVTSVVLAVAALGALLCWLAPSANRRLPIERGVSAVAITPVLFWVLDSVGRLVGLTDDIRSLAAIAAAVLVAAATLGVAALRPSAIARVTLDAGVLCVAALGLFATFGSGLEWLALLLAALAALLLATSPGGLVAAAGQRKHVGWVALALAVAALWWRLSTESVTAVEPWVLPISGVLLLVAALVWRGARSAGAFEGAGTSADAAHRAAAHRAAAGICLAALLVALVPIGIAGATGPPTRALLVGMLSAALLLAGSLPRDAGASRRYLDAVAVAGVGGVLAAGLPRAATELVAGRTETLVADAWVIALAAVLVCAAIGQSRIRDAHSVPRLWSGRAAVLLAMSIVLLFATLGFVDPVFGAVRAVAVVCALSLLYVLASLRSPTGAPPQKGLLGPFIRWMALAYALVAAALALTAPAVGAVELVTLPVAAAMLVVGGVALARVPSTTSWATLGPALGILLLPSLLLGGDRPVWRLVAVGVVALLVFVAGVRLRLQAPVLIGAVVVLVHAATTFAPQIRSVYELTEWWVWAGIGGIPIIVYAALAERSVRTTRSVVMTIGSLR